MKMEVRGCPGLSHQEADCLSGKVTSNTENDQKVKGYSAPTNLK